MRDSSRIDTRKCFPRKFRESHTQTVALELHKHQRECHSEGGMDGWMEGGTKSDYTKSTGLVAMATV